MQFPLMVAETEAVVTQKDAEEEEEVPSYD